MDEPQWITDEAARAIHRRQLDEFGGIEGVRDSGLLDSALARPRNAFAYAAESADVASLAAAYAFGIARNHPFLDGNKRTAAVVCETFILANGQVLQTDNDAWYAVLMHLAAGEISEEDFAAWLRERVVEAE